ncbi:hypothetical protein ABZY09_45870 [Streptomyces sp. NPDC002928]|uniref:hypothetical protein n=1 Tax=Streptomyces sp. NPDC002928 TaxID=3154440 RepID=UPI0033A6CDEC
MRLFRAEFHRRLPQEQGLRTTARQWFLIEMIRTASRIELSIESAELKALTSQLSEDQAHLAGVD